jgi:hypothetical protein
MKLKPFFLFSIVWIIVFNFHEVTAQNVWIQKTDLPGAARQDATGFVIGDNIYVTCGRSYGVGILYNDLWQYNTLNDSWTQKASLPAAGRYGAAGFTAGAKGYVCCGRDTSLFADLWQYDPQADSWTQKANFPGAPRSDAFVFVLFNNAYIGTGALTNGPTSDMWMYDSVDDTWTQLADFPAGSRYSAFGISNGDTGYVGGGIEVTFNWQYLWLHDFWKYDASNDTWSQLADFGTSGRADAAAFVSGNKITTGVGMSGFSTYNDSNMWQYNSASDIWDPVAPFGGGLRSNAVSFGINGNGYMGTGMINSTVKSDWWEFLPPITEIPEAEKGNLSVYPNPASDKITVINELNSVLAEIKILDLSERIKKEFDMLYSPTTFSIADLDAGIYIMKVSDGKKTTRRKIAVTE